MAKIKVPFLVVAIGFLLFVDGCSTRIKAPVKLQMGYVQPTPPVIVYIDTIKPKKIDTNKLMDKFYLYGYEKYYGPKFEKMAATIEKQATSIQALTTTIQQMRTRSIHNHDSLQRVDNGKDLVNDTLRRAILDAQTERLKAEKERITQNTQELGSLQRITNFLIWGFVSLWGMILIMWVIWYLWMRNMNRNIKKANYA